MNHFFLINSDKYQTGQLSSSSLLIKRNLLNRLVVKTSFYNPTATSFTVDMHLHIVVMSGLFRSELGQDGLLLRVE